MIPKEPKSGSGREPRYIRDQRSWGRDVVRTLRHLHQPTDTSIGNDWERTPSFSARFKHHNEISATQDLVVAAGLAVRDTAEITVATADITLPVSGDLFVYVTVALGAGTGLITSSATRPDYRPDSDTVNVVLGLLEETETGYWDWTPYHVGDILIEELPGAAGDTNLAYPFEGSIVSNTIKIGADRAEADYYFHDHIMCGNDKLAKTVAETTSTISATSYVYYACTKSGATITATLSHKTVASGWPTDSDGTENYVLGVAVYAGGSITVWAPAHISGQIRIGSARFS